MVLSASIPFDGDGADAHSQHSRPAHILLLYFDSFFNFNSIRVFSPAGSKSGLMLLFVLFFVLVCLITIIVQTIPRSKLTFETEAHTFES